MGLVSVCIGIWRRRRPERAVQRRNSRLPSETRRKRETLQKRMPSLLGAELAMNNAVLEEDAGGPAELGIELPRRGIIGGQESRQLEKDPKTAPVQKALDPPAGCVELPAETAPRRQPSAALVTEASKVDVSGVAEGQKDQTEQFKPHRTSPKEPPIVLEATKRQRSQALSPCSPCLVPGLSQPPSKDRPYKPPIHAATWSEGSSKATTPGSAPRRPGFGSGWLFDSDLSHGTYSDGQTLSPPNPSWTSGSESPTAFSPPSPRSQLSSETSLASKDAAEPKPHRRTISLMQNASSSHLPLEATLLPRQSNPNMKHLIARHSLLESRRQILLQLQEIEHEQQQILEELATMPEEN